MATGQKDIDAGLLAMKKGALDTNIAILEYTKTLDDIVSADYIKGLEDIVNKGKAELAALMPVENKATTELKNTDMVQLAKSQNAPDEFVKNLENVLGTTPMVSRLPNIPIAHIHPQLLPLINDVCDIVMDKLAESGLKGKALKDAVISYVNQGLDEMVTDIVGESEIDSIV